jgi:hypothetical protein
MGKTIKSEKKTVSKEEKIKMLTSVFVSELAQAGAFGELSAQSPFNWRIIIDTNENDEILRAYKLGVEIF